MTIEADRANRNGFCEQRPEQGGKLRLQALARLGRGQRAGQRHVEAKLVEDVGIAPAPQQRLLARREARLQAAIDLTRRERRGQGIERQRIVEGQSVSGRVDLGCCRIIKTKKTYQTEE